jgi:general secretion pathway protein B
MSYILDALKKSEQERAQGDVPDIKTVHTPATVAAPQQSVSWLYIILISMLLAAGIVFLWLKYLQPLPPSAEPAPALAQAKPSAPAQAPKIPPVQEKQRAAPPAVQSKPKPAQVKPPQTDKAQQDVKPKAKSNVVFLKQEIPEEELYSHSPYHPDAKRDTVKSDTKAKQNVAAKQEPVVTHERVAEPDIVAVTALPNDLRKRLPDITFSGHVYSSVPARRSVIINGKQMREGEFVNDDLKLEKITSKGAVFSLGDVWFRLGAMQDWNSH